MKMNAWVDWRVRCNSKMVMCGCSLVFVIGGCAPAQLGPSFSQMRMLPDDMIGVEAEYYLSNLSTKAGGATFPLSLVQTDAVNHDELMPGDILQVTIFENVMDGIFSTDVSRASTISEIEISQKGTISLPYVGEIEIVGRSLAQGERLIQQKLESQTPSPQITLKRVRGSTASVTVLGAVQAQGIYQIEPHTDSILEIIGKAGGLAGPGEAFSVEVKRGGDEYRANLRSIREQSSQNIAVIPGDIITIVPIAQSVSVIGAVGTQRRLDLNGTDLNLLDVLGEAGGLSPTAASAAGVFVFREEQEKLGNKDYLIEFDLRTLAGMRSARKFKVLSGDTIYVAETTSRETAKRIRSILDVLQPVDSIRKGADL